MITPEIYAHHHAWMQEAIALAKSTGDAGEIPVAAIVVDAQNKAIARCGNHKERDQDPTAHAEILAIRAASHYRQDWRLDDCTLYVTLEPCPMCTGSIIHSRLRQVVYGADDPKTGALRSMANLPDHPFSNHTLNVIGGIAAAECRQLLQEWFRHCRLN